MIDNFANKMSEGGAGRLGLISLAIFVPIVLLLLTLTPLVGAGAVAPAGGAAVITVTTTDDELNVDGDCSLREAIQAANTDTAVDACPAGGGADTVMVPAGTYTLTIPGVDENNNASGDLDIRDNLILQGAGASSTSIDGGALDRVLHVLQTSATIDGITIANGRLNSLDIVAGAGGGLFNESGKVIVLNSVVRRNRAALGGGLMNMDVTSAGSTLVVDHSEIVSNTTDGTGAPGMRGGAGIGSRAYVANGKVVLTVSHSIVAGNNALNSGSSWGKASGGGISSSAYSCFSCQTKVVVKDSTIRSNTASLAGGVAVGEVNTTGSSSAELFIEGSSIRDNSTSGIGTYMGSAGGVGSGAYTTILNSTISGNRALGEIGIDTGDGGGIWMGSNNVGFGTLTITHSTVADNEAVSEGGGVYSANSGTELNFFNNVIAGNTAPSGSNCFREAGIFASWGHNIEDTDECEFDQPTDQVNTDPLLGPLQDNGGDTWTHALLPGSSAIDQGSCSALSADQRGLSRPVDIPGIVNADDGCDIGAFELQVAEAYSFAVNPIELSGLGSPGESVVYTFYLTNTGSLQDAYTVTVGAEWVVSGTTTIGPMGPGAGDSFGVTVTVPSGAAHGDFDVTYITAVSQGNPSVMASAMVTTTAVLEITYLPVIIHN